MQQHQAAGQEPLVLHVTVASRAAYMAHGAKHQQAGLGALQLSMQTTHCLVGRHQGE